MACRAGARRASCDLGAEAVHNLLRLTNEPADGRPEDLGQFAVLLALLSIAALVATTRGVDRRTALQVIAAIAVAAASVRAARQGNPLSRRTLRPAESLCLWTLRRRIAAQAVCSEYPLDNRRSGCSSLSFRAGRRCAARGLQRRFSRVGAAEYD